MCVGKWIKNLPRYPEACESIKNPSTLLIYANGNQTLHRDTSALDNTIKEKQVFLQIRENTQGSMK